MSEPIKPALTAEEWAELKTHLPHNWAYINAREDGGDSLEEHGMAAAALYGQPFGFTREDVEQLRGLVRLYESGDAGFHWDREIAWANSLADRIEALLPREP